MKPHAQWCLIIVLIGSHCTEEENDVRKPPKIIKSPKRMETFRDRGTVTLDCKAEGIPGVTYVWQKDGSDLNLNIEKYKKTADGSLTIEGLTKDDEGLYQCMAQNQYGKAISDLTQLRMAFLRTKVLTTETKTVTESQPFHLVPTPPDSFPRPTFSWETALSTTDPNPIPLQLSRRVQIDDEGNLHFAWADRQDKLSGKIYKSTSFNAITDERKGNNYATVEITPGNVTNFAPQLGFSSKNETIAILGRPLALRCFFNGYPVPDVTWPNRRYQFGERVSLTSEKFKTELKINSVIMSDEGNYTCTGTNSGGQMSHIIDVRVEAEPKFNKESDSPHDININEGESVTINCTAQAIPEADVAWFKNGKRLNRDSLPPKFSLPNGGKGLMIRDVCRDCNEPDLAVIQCNASNVHGYAFASGYINVLKRTEVTVSSKSGDLNVSVEIGKENVFEFSCTVQSDPITVVQLRWHKRTEKDYSPIRLPSKTLPNATLKDNVLTIRFTSSLNDSKWQIYLGEYFCVGENKYSVDSKSVFAYSNPGPVPEHHFQVVAVDNTLLINVVVIAAICLINFIVIIVCFCRRRKREDAYQATTTEMLVTPHCETVPCDEYEIIPCDGYETIPCDVLSTNQSPSQVDQCRQTTETARRSDAVQPMYSTISDNTDDPAYDNCLATAEGEKPNSLPSTTAQHDENTQVKDDYTGFTGCENVYLPLYTDLQQGAEIGTPVNPPTTTAQHDENTEEKSDYTGFTDRENAYLTMYTGFQQDAVIETQENPLSNNEI